MDIIKTNWGVANYYSNPERIEINEILYEPEFENLKNRIIQHERKHSKAKGFIAQRRVDASTKIKFSDLIPIYKRKPILFFQQHSPITYKDNTLFFEWSIIFLLLIYTGIGTLIYYLIKLFSKDSAFFLTISKNMVIILIIVFFVYFGGKRLFKYINEESAKELTKK